MNIVDVHKDLQDHKKEDAIVHNEVVDVRNEIKTIRENHLAHIQVSLTRIETDLSWLLKFFWIVSGLMITAVVGSLLNMILK